MSGLVFFIFLALIAARFLAATLNRSNGSQSSARQFQALAERLRQASRTGQSGSQPTPGWQPPASPPPPPPFQAAAPPVVWTPPATQSAPQPAPVIIPAEPVGPSAAEIRARHDRLASSLDSSMSSTLGTPLADDHPVLAGPRVIELPADLQRRAMEYMDQNYEVMAVRLVCDEMHVGILDAQKTVRTLAGLPTL